MYFPVLFWNSQKRLFYFQPIDEYTDISYQVCAEAAGGVVSTRYQATFIC
jgi:hypothetical protein